MEFIESISTIGLVFIMILCSVFALNKMGLVGKNMRKSAKKTDVENADKEINQYYSDKIRTMQEMHQEECKLYKKKIQSLTNAVNGMERWKKRYSDEEEEEDDNDNELEFAEKYEIDFNKAKEYASKIGIDSNGITDPEILPIVVEKIKENEELALMLGIIRRKGTMGNMASNQQNGNQSPIDATAQALIDAGQYA